MAVEPGDIMAVRSRTCGHESCSSFGLVIRTSLSGLRIEP